MHTLARVCVERPVFATVLSLTLIVVGLVSYSGLGVDRYPKIDFPRVSVTTRLPGASPDEVETDITDVIERQVNSIGGIEVLTSTSAEGTSSVSLQFDMKKDIDVAAEEVRAKVAMAKRDLPPDALDPVVAKMDLGALPVVSFAFSSSGSVRETYEYVDKVIRRRVESVNGVGEAQIVGGRQRQVNVVVDPYRLRAYGLTPADVSSALSRQNAQVPGGIVEQGHSQMPLRTLGRVDQVSDFEGLLLRNLGATQVFMRDVAKVEDAEARAMSVATVDGRETVLIQIVKQSDANAIEVIRGVKQRIEQLRKTLPAGYTVTVVRDQSAYIERSLSAVREHLILGALLAALVVLVFLGNWRSTLIAALAIPTSIIATFGLMKALDFTQNSVTLLALTLSVGIVIDDAIVVLENIFRVMEEEGLPPHEAAIRATKEIGLAVVAITLSLVAVFLPVAFMSGTQGRMLNSFGITMAGAIVVSMLVSFSTTPMLCARWLTLRKGQVAAGEHGHGAGGTKAGWFGWVEHAYAELLHRCIRVWPAVVICCVAVLFSAVPLIKMTPANYMPDDDESQFQVSVRAPEGTSLDGTLDYLNIVAAEARKLPEVKLVVLTAGDDAQRTANLGLVYIRMNEVEERRDRKVTQYTNMALARKTILPKLAGRGLRLSVQKASSFGSGSTASVQVAVKGQDIGDLTRVSEEALRRVRRIPGVADAESSLIAGKPELRAYMDRNRAAAVGADVQDVAQALRLAVAGDDKITSFDEGGEGYEVHMRLHERYRRDAANLALLSVPTTYDGQRSSVTVDQVARLVQSTAPANIDRLGRQRQFTMRVNPIKGVSENDIAKQVIDILTDLTKGPGYSIEKLGRTREMTRMFKNFGMAAALSFVFMYLVIAAQFESFIHALVIMFTLPLTLPFAVFSVWITGDSLNTYSLLGLLVLLGVVKKNAILQIDRANQLREAGLDIITAVVQASRDRLRPILMTTLAFVAGMFPLVLARGTGSATSRTTSSVIVGGQVLSLALTLIAAPVIYVALDGVFQSRVCVWLRSVFFRHRHDAPDEQPTE
ncbi:MAG: efflux RND transporter permease subunit [Armatimonadetes bacterium]|nr:efflux RND transporter permease subunit [Armatimonadota bacterium]